MAVSAGFHSGARIRVGLHGMNAKKGAGGERCVVRRLHEKTGLPHEGKNPNVSADTVLEGKPKDALHALAFASASLPSDHHSQLRGRPPCLDLKQSMGNDAKSKGLVSVEAKQLDGLLFSRLSLHDDERGRRLLSVLVREKGSIHGSNQRLEVRVRISHNSEGGVKD